MAIQEPSLPPRLARILAPTDFSECATRAVDLAVDMARTFDAELLVLHVLPASAYLHLGAEFEALPGAWYDQVRQAARNELAKESARIVWPNTGTLLLEGPVAETIVATAARMHAEMIVLGTHGRRGLAHALLGSVAERVVRESRAPVMTVRGGG